MSKRTAIIILVVIAIVGSGLRLYRLGEFINFGSDEAEYLYDLRAMTTGHHWLEGPPLRGPYLGENGYFNGPFFYYLLFPFFIIFGGQPTAIAVAVALAGIATIVVMYGIGAALRGRMTGLIAALLYAVSFVTVYYNRYFWIVNILPLFLSLYLYFLVKVSEKKSANCLYAAAVFFSIAVQLHPIVIFLAPLLAVGIWGVSSRIAVGRAVVSIGLILTVNLPYVVGYAMTGRPAPPGQSFGHTVVFLIGRPETYSKIASYAQGLVGNFFTGLISAPDFWISAAVLLVTIGWVGYQSLQRQSPLKVRLVFLWLVCILLPLALYRGPHYTHYFIATIPPLIAALALVLTALLRRSVALGIVAVVCLVVFNITAVASYFRDAGNLATTQAYPAVNSDTVITIAHREKIIDSALEGVPGNDINLTVVPDYQEKVYTYLLELRGYHNTPGANRQFIVSEDDASLPVPAVSTKLITTIGNVKLFVKE